MWKNRIVLIILIVASGVLVSHYGGSFSYTLFYFSLGIPLVSLLYSIYVYSHFKLYQFTGNKTIVKGETTEYSFQLANEDVITFESLKVNFFHDRSKVFHLDEGREYCLLPKQKIDMKTRITCEYRGEYFVGVESVVITDFLYLFRIKYPIRDKLPIQVLPRIINIEAFPLLFPDYDSKSGAHRKSGDEEPDIEVRNYVPGDSRKRIHWKVSAKRNEWMVRKYVQIPEPEIQIFVDFSETKEEKELKYIVEDKVLEAAIASAKFYCNKKINCKICYDQGQQVTVPIINEQYFKEFYENCIHIKYNSRMTIGDFMDTEESYENGQNTILIITHRPTKKLYQNLVHRKELGQECAVIYVSNLMKDEDEALLGFIEDIGVRVLKIAGDQDVKERLETAG